VDESYVFQCVGDHTVAYHCGYNQDSIGVEMCDNPSMEDPRTGRIIAAPKSRWDDDEHRRLERRTARLVAELCLAYNIRPYYVGRWKLLAGMKGVTTHAAMSKAYKRSTHWDPGAWRRYRFMRRVRRQVARIKKGL
jgi:hypothetical protein